MKLDWIFDEKLRGTGRTTRMIEKAKELALEGRAVYILSANLDEQKRIRKLLGNNDLGISVETSNSISTFRWETMSLLGAHPNCVVLVDHYAVENVILRRLQGLGPAIRSLISDQFPTST